MDGWANGGGMKPFKERDVSIGRHNETGRRKRRRAEEFKEKESRHESTEKKEKKSLRREGER